MSRCPYCRRWQMLANEFKTIVDWVVTVNWDERVLDGHIYTAVPMDWKR